MQVILTPTAVADKFGPGLNGFAGSVPGPPTQMSEQWFDSVQMEIVNVILGQGIALDGLKFDQLKDAFDDYVFADPEISGSLTISAGAIFVNSGAGFVLKNGSTFAVEANVTLVASDNTWVWGSSNANDWTINGDLTLGTDSGNVMTVKSTTLLTENATLAAGKTLTGGAGSSILSPSFDNVTSAGFANIGELRFIVDASPAFTAGFMQWDGKSLRIGNGVGADVVPVHQDSWLAGDVSTVNAIDDTGASVTVYLLTGEKCIVTMSMETANTNVGATINLQLTANAVIVGGTAARYQVSANIYSSVSRTVQYTAGADGNVVFKSRHGAAAGTTTSRNIHVTARRSD